MRLSLILLPVALIASPALAQSPDADIPAIPPELSDPRNADRLVDALKVLSGAFLELPIGEVEAAMEGRQPTAADKRRTVRSESKMSERELQQKLEQSKPMMRASLKALTAALPAMLQSMSGVAKELEKAATNMPQPGYPKQ